MPTGADPAGEQRFLLGLLAELVAKLAHNEAGPAPFFDHDTGWRIAPLAVRLAEAGDDPAVRRRIAEALGEWPPDLAAE